MALQAPRRSAVRLLRVADRRSLPLNSVVTDRLKAIRAVAQLG